jgi:uncharacterized membrane protein (UPF0127 family)
MKKNIRFGKTLLAILLISVIAVFYTTFSIKRSPNPDKYTLNIQGKELTVEVADTPQKRKKGLMYRNEMPADEGMIFFFGSEGDHSIWMKNTYIPLDIIWVGADKKIVHIESNVPPCEKDPCKSYESKFPSKYVIEVNAGWVSKNKIEVGDVVEFSDPLGNI